jgi:hypothetical protein
LNEPVFYLSCVLYALTAIIAPNALRISPEVVSRNSLSWAWEFYVIGVICGLSLTGPVTAIAAADRRRLLQRALRSVVLVCLILGLNYVSIFQPVITNWFRLRV